MEWKTILLLKINNHYQSFNNKISKLKGFVFSTVKNKTDLPEIEDRNSIKCESNKKN